MQEINPILAIVFGGIVALWMAWPSGIASAAEPVFGVPLGERQLFLDDVGIAKIEILNRAMHRPDKKGAVIRPDWHMGEQNKQTRTVPVWNPDRKIFQFLDLYGNEPPVSDVSGYYESTDGLHWRKPNVGQIEFRGSKPGLFTNSMISSVAQPRSVA